MEQMDVAIVKQQRSKHISMVTDTDSTIQNAVFSKQYVPMLYNKDKLDKQVN
jgi:hypothetical protein